MSPFLAEFIGTAVILFLGIGVVANVSLNKTKAFGSSPTGKWILITTAWGFAVFFGIIVSGTYSGAHLNPAVTVDSQLPINLNGQMYLSTYLHNFLVPCWVLRLHIYFIATTSDQQLMKIPSEGAFLQNQL